MNNCILQPKIILKKILEPKVSFELLNIVLHDEVESLHVVLCSHHKMDHSLKWDTILEQLRNVLYVNLCLFKLQ